MGARSTESRASAAAGPPSSKGAPGAARHGQPERDFGPQPHDQPCAPDAGPVLGSSTAPPATDITHGPPDAVALRQHTGLLGPKGGLAIRFRNIWHGSTGLAGNLVVAVEVGPLRRRRRDCRSSICGTIVASRTRVEPITMTGGWPGRRRGCAQHLVHPGRQIAQGLTRHDQRHHRLGDHAHGRHRRHVGALLERHRRLLAQVTTSTVLRVGRLRVASGFMAARTTRGSPLDIPPSMPPLQLLART